MVWATRSAGSRLISFIDERPSRRKPSSPSTVRVSSAARTSSRVKVVVEEADEGADGAGGVVVLGLAEEEGGAALDVAEVDVVAEGGAADAAAAVDGEHDLGLGVVPARDRVEADHRAAADGGHRLALGEDLGVGADADLEVLAPQALVLERLLGGGGGVAARHDVAERGADQAGDAVADLLGAGRVAGGALLDDALDHRAGEGDAAGLERLEVAGSEKRADVVGERAEVAAGGRGEVADGSSSSSRSRIVGASRAVTSWRWPSRRTTRIGPPAASSQRRPTRVPAASSGCGSGSLVFRSLGHRHSLPCRSPRRLGRHDSRAGPGATLAASRRRRRARGGRLRRRSGRGGATRDRARAFDALQRPRRGSPPCIAAAIATMPAG